MEYKNFFLESFEQKYLEELISYCQDHCRKNYNDFHQLTIFLKSIAEIERQRNVNECEHKNFSQQQFDEKTKRFKNRKELYPFILNTLSLIIYTGDYYCFCEKFMKKKSLSEKNCAICQIPLIFCNF